MKYSKDYEKLGLPENLKFGIELEAYNVKTKGRGGLYTGKSAEYIKQKNWHMAKATEESLVAKGGAEVVSPVLVDNEKTWMDIADICEHIKKYPGKNGDKVVADEKCGLHVHFDSECLTKNPERMKNFLKLYSESEELIYKMCNDKDNPIRRGAINRDFKGIAIISSIWRKGMAAPSSKKIKKQIENEKLKLSYKKFGKMKMLASKFKLDGRRYHGLNLTNIGNKNKNTIEFRMANGTLDLKIIKQNIFLYSLLLKTSIEITDNPQKYEKKLEEFNQTDISEKEKAERFLNLIIEKPEDKKIYMERWKSVKDAEVFEKNDKKGFAKNTFKREEFKEIAQKTPKDRIKKIYKDIKQMINVKEQGENCK